MAATKKPASGPAVKWCSCASSFQDQRYGEHMRLHNATTAEKKPPWRCTVCARERE